MAITSLLPQLPPPNAESKTGGAMAVEKSLDALKAIALHPVYSMVAAVALIEYLQTVQIADPNEFGWWPQQGTHALYYGPRPKALISQPLATTLESVIITSNTISELGGLASILKLFV